MNFFFEWKILPPDDIKVTDWISACGSILGPLATFAAIFVALFKKRILNYCLGPKLKIVTGEDQRYIFNIPQNNGGNAIYLNFKVQNHGKTMAKNVAVIAQRIRGVTVKNQKVDHFLDMPLILGNTGGNYSKHPNLQSETGMYWNLGMIANPKFRNKDGRYFCRNNWPDKYEENEPALLITVTYPLEVGNHIVGCGRYLIDILIVADQVKPIKKTIVIDTSKLRQWPMIVNTDNKDEIRKKEEDEISKKILFDVDKSNTCSSK
jgi:hypothetical protein